MCNKKTKMIHFTHRDDNRCNIKSVKLTTFRKKRNWGKQKMRYKVLLGIFTSITNRSGYKNSEKSLMMMIRYTVVKKSDL